MFVDASVIVAGMLNEPGSDELLTRLKSTSAPSTSPIAIWEATVAISRALNLEISLSRRQVREYLHLAGVEMLPITDEVGELALEAFDRFGKGRHPAKLNMGDCFAYACARHHKMPLLYKGDDFPLTDIDRL